MQHVECACLAFCCTTWDFDEGLLARIPFALTFVPVPCLLACVPAFARIRSRSRTPTHALPFPFDTILFPQPRLRALAC